ncbi:YHYH protein [Algibacter sp. 2305UL17-15]|uniref:YHYH protein n=1 Tax=Algibacter sp. 2305UL17-15 TaxID=3231268 RepID=UPI00345AD951
MSKYICVIGIIAASVLLACNSHVATNMHHHDHEENHSHSQARENTSMQQNAYFGDYSLNDENFGTKTTVVVNGETRKMVTNALPNHKTGEYPRKGNPNTISAQNKSYSFPVNPKYTGTPQWVREPGVALNGVKFEPGTAEVVVCDTGENYRVEAFQDMINLGLDFNNAHVQPTGAYHYHGSPTSVIENFDTGEDLVHVGFAHDGFPMYYSKSGAYKPSYELVKGTREGENCTYTNPKKTLDIAVDGHHNGTYTSDFEYVEGTGDLDECNGISIAGKYMYLVTNEFPYVSRCLMGEVAQETQRGNSSGGRQRGEDHFKQMDSNKDGKLSQNEIKGPLKAHFSEIDTNDDGYLTQEELEKEVIQKGRRRRNR